ncbi:Jasmonate O-methyltransferase [Apostasia shenzhenica]|uniref:Jasmonate O-methyltransferase n=1 Tax=Apostasia shenzhenica TaxID=1088818 RepID=A0A2I0A4M8_9ASPA|nr:Jasmonate O-methyltransferase [Apostasia shenzhenica]
MEEVKLIIAEEGSFELNQAQTFDINWDPFDDSIDDPVINNTTSSTYVAKYIRAVTEPLLVPHFGEQIMDDLFSRYAKNVATHMLKKTCKYATFILSLKLKGKSAI